MEDMARNRSGLPDDPVDASAAIRGRLGLPDPLARTYGDPVRPLGLHPCLREPLPQGE